MEVLICFFKFKGPKNQKERRDYTPENFHRDTHQKSRYLKKSYLFKTIIFFGIHVKFMGCIISNCYSRPKQNVLTSYTFAKLIVTFVSLVKVWRHDALSYTLELWFTHFNDCKQAWRRWCHDRTCKLYSSILWHLYT